MLRLPHALCKKGFTLIELLVVVLILAILAAIALPQYQIAVEKARVTAIMPLLRSIDSAQKLHYLTYGKYSVNIATLTDIELPPYTSLTTTETSQTINGKNYSCLLRYGTATTPSTYSTYCTPKSVSGVKIEKYYNSTYFHCWASKTDERQQQVCQKISGLESNSGYNEGSLSYYF